jgi:predicted Zn-dependent protease
LGLRLAPILIVLVMAGMYAMKGCQEGPFGRQQIVGMDAQQEAALGLQSFQEVLAQSQVIDRGALPETVVKIGKRLAEAANRPEFLNSVGMKAKDFEWDFRLIAGDQINAFCLPGGKVVVYTGIVPVAQTEAGLATVLGHEIGHALAHHGAERMAQAQLVQFGQMAVMGSMSDMDPNQVRQVMAVLGAGSQVGILLPFSRKHESEADHIGILLMAAAGYDPREAPRFWERMTEATQGSQAPPEFMSTHPSGQTRQADLNSWLPDALPIFEQSQQQNGGKPLPGLRDALQDALEQRFEMPQQPRSRVRRFQMPQ